MTPLRSKRGYTLLELIVSIGIFSIVMMTATSAYLTLIDLDRQARATNDIVSNLSFAVDSMSRAVRTGTSYKCNKTGTNCLTIGSPGTSLRFTDETGRTVDYELSGTQIQETVTPLTGAAFTSKLTDPRITISALNFYVRGVSVESGTKIQPQVTFIIAGTMNVGKNKTVSFSVEGGATERLLELP